VLVRSAFPHPPDVEPEEVEALINVSSSRGHFSPRLSQNRA